MRYAKFAAVFETTGVEPTPMKVISDPVTVEVVREERRLMLSPVRRAVWSADRGGEVPLEFTPLVLDPQKYHVILTARTREEKHDIARRSCEEEIDRVMASVSVIYDGWVFGVPIYRGWIFEPQARTFLEGTGVIAQPINIDLKFLEKQLATAKVNQVGGARNDGGQRFKLISKFFRQSLTAETPEVRLFYLWTILEVFPMMDTSNIRPIGELLADIMGKPYDIVKEKLAIGRIYAARCDLVLTCFSNRNVIQ